MTRKQFVQLIEAVESKYKTSLLQTKGVIFWPMMRMALFGIYHKKKNPDQGESQSVKFSNSKWSYLSRFLLVPITWIKMLYLKLTRKRVEAFFTGDISEHIDIDGESVNRFFYVFFQNHKENSEGYTYLNTRSMILPVGGINLDIKSLILYELLVLKTLKPIKFSTETNEVFRNICKEVANEISVEVAYTEQTVLKALNSSVAAEKVFSRLLKQLAPKKVVSVSYYGTEVYGLFIASRKAGIPTMDIQHGAQGKLHLAYSSFTAVPTSGYHMLPNYFWVWDQQSERDIESWSKEQRFHKVIRGGQPWLSAQLADTKKRRSPLKTILFTMQFPKLSALEQTLIMQTCKDFKWYLKAHPTWEHEVDKLQKELDQIPFSENVTLLPPKSSLVDYLYNADIHVSRYSGSIIEASLLGTYSVITDIVGVSTFQEIIDQKRAFTFLKGEGDFLLFAKNILNLPELSSTVLDLDEIYTLYNRI